MGVSQDAITVLHVDDEPEFVEMAAAFLEREGAISVTTATSASEGLAKLDARDVDAIVSDYQMPGMDGLEFLDAVREDHPRLPFILLTGHGSEEVAGEAINAGVTAYFQKNGHDQFQRVAHRLEQAVDQTRVERELEETQARFQALTGTASFAVVTIDEESVIQFANVAVEDVFGYDPAELEGESLEMLIPDRLQDAHFDAVDRYLETGDRNFGWGWVELPGRRKDGEEIPLGITFGETETAEGRLFTGIIRDISEQVDREQRLREQRDRFETVFEHANDAIFVIDPSEETILEANPKASEMFGYDQDELVGLSLRELHPDDMDEVRAFGEVVLENETGRRTSLTCCRKDGQEIPTDVAASPIEYENQWCLLAIVRDISDRQEREHELERYERIIEAVNDGVYAFDDDGYFTFVNSHIEEMLGWDREDIIGAPPSKFLSEDAIERVSAGIQEILDGEQETFSIELEMKTASGDTIITKTNIAPLTEDGEYQGNVGVVRDITDRKRREEELQRQNERLEEFTSMVSHDLRNPLYTANGRLALAKEECDSDHLDRVEDAHERMETLIEDLLTFSRQGRTVEKTEDVPLPDAVEEATRNLDLSCDVRTLEEVVMRAHRDRLAQLLGNLLLNAEEHAGAESTVRIGPLADHDGFYVADDGPGIPQADRDQVFDHGYTTTDDGSGFGLSIVQAIADAHGWEVTVSESETGGARFEIRGVGVA